MLHANATSDACNRPTTALRPPPRHVRRPPAEHSRADLARNRFAPHPTTPTSCKEANALIEARQRMCGSLVDSKKRSRNALPKSEQRVSNEQALTAQDKETTMRPPRAR